MRSAVDVGSIGALKEMYTGLAGFGSGTAEVLARIRLQIESVRQWLGEHGHAAQREYAEAQNDLASLLYYDPEDSDTGAYLAEAHRRCQQAEAALTRTRIWQVRINQAIIEYERQAFVLSTRLDAELPRGLNFLGSAVAVLEEYARDSGIKRVGEPTINDSRLLDDAEDRRQIRSIGSVLRGKDEIRPQVWGELDLGKRLAVLQELERKIAAIQGRPAADLEIEALDDLSLCGSYTPASTNESGRIIINQTYVTDGDVSNVLDTLIHEGRHAYQHYAGAHPGFLADDALELEWTENLKNYRSAEDFGQRLYEGQPIEVDARQYADRVLRQLDGDPTEGNER